MKKIIQILIFAFSINAWSSNISQTYCISYNLDDFSLMYDSNNNLQISTDKQHFFSENNEPGLPLLPYQITLDGQYSYITSKVDYKEVLIKSNVSFQKGPVPEITDSNHIVSESSDLPYPLGIYPNENFVYSTQSRWSDLTVFHFIVCPFRYDSNTRNLYFIQSFSVDVTFVEDNNKSSKNRFRQIAPETRKILRTDSEKVLSEYVESSAASENSSDSDIEYLIVTTDSLRKSFEPLSNWKRTKGLRSKIISVEDIYSKYPGASNPLKIKNCLYDLYQNNGLVYVLLGGDDSIVPVQGCYSKVGN